VDRRAAIVALAGTAAAPLLARARAFAAPAEPDFAAIEASVNGRLGVAVVDLATRRRLTYRADERFPMCSTFKWLLGALVLVRVDVGREQLDRFVPYGESDLLDYAPITRQHVTEGRLTVEQLVDAAIRYSDNTAANLLLASAGGPDGFTEFLRSLGDRTTRLDRIEPELNSATPGDPRDTTSPMAMLENMQLLLVGNHLADASRQRLLDWLVGNTTGAGKLRAGFPADWRVGDKTGMGANGSTNDVAIAWPPDRRPVLVAAYLTETTADVDARNAALAAVGRAVAGWVA